MASSGSILHNNNLIVAEATGRAPGVKRSSKIQHAYCKNELRPKERTKATYRSRGRNTQLNKILCRWCNLKEIWDYNVVTGDSLARQHWMVLCRMAPVVRKRNKAKGEQRINWSKQKKEVYWEDFRERLKQALGGFEEMPYDLITMTTGIRETGRKLFVCHLDRGQMK